MNHVGDRQFSGASESTERADARDSTSVQMPHADGIPRNQKTGFGKSRTTRSAAARSGCAEFWGFLAHKHDETKESSDPHVPRSFVIPNIQ